MFDVCSSFFPSGPICEREVNLVCCSDFVSFVLISTCVPLSFQTVFARDLDLGCSDFVSFVLFLMWRHFHQGQG